MKNRLKIQIPAFLSSDKGRIVFVIVGLSAILLIFFSSILGSDDNKTEDITSLDASTYCSLLSADLVDMLENIDGAGETRVLLTLESSYEYVYLDDDKTVSKILEPKIRGVAVACAGGENPVVIEKITHILTTVLSLSAGDISVTKLS